MSAVNFIISLARKILARESKGITTIPNRMAVERKAGEIAARLQDAGLPLNRADEFIRSEQDLVGILNQIEALEKRNLAENIRGGIRSTESAKVFNIKGDELDPNKPIIGGTQPGKTIDQSTSKRLDERNAQLIKQRIADKKVETDAEIKARLDKDNKEGIARIRARQKMLDDAIDNVSSGFSGDRKVDAELVAEDLAERMGLVYDDLPLKEQTKLYGEAFDALSKKRFEDFATGGRAGFANGTGAPSIKLFPRAKGRQIEGEVGFLPPGFKVSERDIDYGITGLLQGDKFFGGAEIDKGKVKVDVVSPDGDTLFKDTVSKDDAVNFILGAGDPRGDKFQIKTDKDFKNMQITLRKTFNKGGRVGLKVGSSLKFLQKVFGRDRFEEIRKRDPEMYKGLLEVVEMYRKRDKEGLKMYLQRFLPHMDDAQIEEFIRGSDGSEGLVGELIRLGSGRDYAGKLDMIKRAEEMRKLDDLEITEKMIRKPNADGGIMRLGFKDGMTRRTFLKILGGAMAIPIVGKFLKPFRTAKGVTKVPMIKTDNVPGKPEWFDDLVNKVIIEGDDVTKKFATGERQSIYQKTLDDGSVVRVTEDVDQGAVRVEYESEANVFGDDVMLQYTKPLADEGAPNPQARFDVAESGPVGRVVGPDDMDIDIDEVGGTSIRDLDSDVSKLKEYATGKKPTMKEILESKKRRDKAAAITDDIDGAQSDAIVRRQGDYDPSDYDDGMASGGIARMLGE